MEENAAAKQPMLLRLNGEEEKDDEDEEEASSATTPSSSSRKSTTVDASESRDRVYESWFREEVNMALPQKVVLLCCGSFNPITNMHLRMFELARDALDATGRYKVVGGIISPVNDAYTKPSLVSAKHRSTMIRLALQTSDWIKLDTWESEQESWLETLKVLKHHRESIESAFNANPPPDTPTKKRKLNSNMSPADEVDFSASSFNLNEGMPRIKLLCGADLLSSFAEPGLWKDQDIEEIVGKYGIVCITRANAVNPENFIYDSDVLTLHRENIHIVTEWIHNEISSTKIRRALSRSKSIKYLVQDPVIEYIKENRLYSKSTLDNAPVVTTLIPRTRSKGRNKKARTSL